MTRTLLIVDDIKTNREILKNMLGGDYSIIEAENGCQALELMSSEYQRISAVLLDLGMPVMDGYEVLSRMRGNKRLSKLPVIVATGQTDAGSEERALKLGAQDYISKPYKSAIIKQRIRNTINLRETAATVNALSRDRLTGLYGRDAFFEKVREMTSQREPGFYIMACFDVDRFKVINDQYGTEKGDEVLRHIARVFDSGFEPNGGVCCRVASDDFAVLYPTDFRDSREIADMRRQAGLVPGLVAPVAFSIGRYVITDPAMSPSAMYDRAMLAAESVKGRYDSRIATYDESMRDHLLHEQEIVTEMESSLKSGQFEVWYQPQYNHSTGAMIGAEALVRWRHPQKGLISPGVFVPVFEQNGFIYALDKYVWESVCKYLKSELDALRAPLPVSVNISRHDVLRVDFVDLITGLVEKYGIPVDLLRLEITESAFAGDTSGIVDVVRRLVDFGFTLEIDDFGSGYSSLNTLKNVPAQVVKLDMRFLEDDGGSRRGGSIIESVVRMTKWLGMSVIAEGVEKMTQADYLKSIGCVYVQGYLYARPIPEEEYRNLCALTGKEEKLLALETVENMDNLSFWDPDSMDTLIFNSYVGAACVFECSGGHMELLRASEKYAQVIGGAGMSVEDALKLDWSEHLEKESAARLVSDLAESVATGREVAGEYVFLDLPGCGRETHLRSTLRVIATAGERSLVYCTNENITAQRKAERRERETAERLKAVMDNVACGITAVTLSGGDVNYILTNEKYYGLLGYTKDQYLSEIGGSAFNTIFPGDTALVGDAVKRVMASGVPETVEYRAIRRSGGIVWLRSNLSTAAFEGVDGKVQLSTYTDITEQKRSEQKLRSSTQQLQTMMDDIPGGFVRMAVGEDGVIRPLYFNGGFLRLTGMDWDELMDIYGQDAMAGVHPEDVPVVEDAVKRMLEKGEARSDRYRLIHKNGGYIWLSIFGRVTRDPAGAVYLSIYYTDDTEQVRAEEEQKELLDNLPYGAALYEMGESGLSAVHLNKRYWELVGRRETTYAGSDFLDALHPDDRGMLSRELEAALRAGRDAACDLRVRYGESGYRPFHVVGRILRKNDGRYSIYAAYTPISDEAMSLQEMLPIALSAMMDSQSEYSFVKDKGLRYICASRQLAKLIALSPEDMAGKTDMELFPGPQAEKFEAEDRRVIEGGETITDSVCALPTEGGDLRYSSTSKFPLKDSSGSIIGVYGIGRDVTEARETKTRLELLTNNIPGGIAVYEGDPEDLSKIRLTYFSDGFCRLFGYGREEYEKLAEKNPLGLVLEQDLPGMLRRVKGLASEGEPMDYVYRARAKDGGVKWINVRAVMGEPAGGSLTVNAVFFDVTERQEATERLRISEEESRLAMQHTNNAVCRYDVATGTLRVPESVRKRFSLPERIENLPYGPIDRSMISPETLGAYTEFYEGIRRGRESGTASFQRMSDSGFCWLEAQYSTIFSDEGRPVSAVISYKDITEQLEKESAYKRWQQSFQNRAPESYSLFRCNISKKSSFDTREGALLSVEFAPGKFDFDQHTAQYVEKYVLEEDCERFSAFMNADSLLSGYYQGKRIVTLEYREKLPRGVFRWLRVTVDLVEHANFADVEAYLLFEDIDRMKRLELATIELAETDPLTGVMNRATFMAKVNNLIATSAPNSQHALMMLDIDGFKQVNDAFGHGAGDQVLTDIAGSLRTALRHGDLVGRLGGDEFMVFLTDIPGDVIAAAKARQICALTRKAFSAEVEISGSIGIAVTPRDGADFNTLYKKVDAALYRVKGTGKDNYVFYHDDMDDARQEMAPPAERPVGVPKTEKKRRMLIVDDSRIDHAMLSNIFAEKFIIEKAKDGASALIRLRHYRSAISVVLLDLVMPGMDGFAVLNKMQESTELRNVPVIVVSGDENRETSLRAIRCGAVDYVTKPVDPDILRIRVQSAISKAENERLRAKNSFLEYQTGEVIRYRTALEQSGIVVVEHDWVAGSFIYDDAMSRHIAGTYDERGLWHILLSDFVAETRTVQKMQEMVQGIATDKNRSGESMPVRLKTPSNSLHWFRMNAYKADNEFGMGGKIYMTFADLGAELPVEEQPGP